MDLVEALHSEVRFWEDMIKQQPGKTAPEIRERFEMARLLAESKLAVLMTDCPDAIN